MNTFNHPSEKQLSLFYDELLDREEANQIQRHAETCEVCRKVLHAYRALEIAFQAEFSAEETERLLGDTVQEVHARIIDSERRARVQSEPGWAWLLTPRALLAGLAVVLLFCGLVSTISVDQVRSWVAWKPAEEPAPKERPLSMEQKQAMLLAAQFVKSTVDSGIERAKAKGEQWGEKLNTFQEEAGKAITLGAISAPQIASPSQTSSEEAPSHTPIDALNRVGQQQMALGVGTSMLSLLTVF